MLLKSEIGKCVKILKCSYLAAILSSLYSILRTSYFPGRRFKCPIDKISWNDVVHQDAFTISLPRELSNASEKFPDVGSGLRHSIIGELHLLHHETLCGFSTANY